VSSVCRVLSQLERDRFYGSVEIKFEAGIPVLLRKTGTIKPEPHDRQDNRGSNRDNVR